MPLVVPFTLLLVVDVLGLVFEKVASVQATGEGWVFYGHLIQQPWMWLGLGMGPVQLLIWKYILARTELSLAYPLTSLSYPLTMLVSVFFLHEKLDITVWLGGVLITVGVAILNLKTKGEHHDAS